MVDKELIMKWLLEENIYKNENSEETSNFHLIINYPEGHMMDVIQPKDKPDVILIGCAFELNPNQLSVINNASNDKKSKFIWDIRLTLNEMLLDFQLEHPNNVLRKFVITEEIYEDALTKDYLMKTIKKVFKGNLQCLWMIDKTFGNVMNVNNQNIQYL